MEKLYCVKLLHSTEMRASSHFFLARNYTIFWSSRKKNNFDYPRKSSEVRGCAGSVNFITRMMERSDPSEWRNGCPRTSINTSLATAIARHLKIPNAIISAAINETSLPCRFEIVQQNPLVIVDGAHNPDKIKNVVHNLKQLTYGRLYTMFASGALKDARSMLRQLSAISDGMTLTTVAGKGKVFYTPRELSRLTPSSAQKTIAQHPRAALKKALQKLQPNDCLLITGSFYLAGDLRKRWISERTVLTKRNHV